jgi:hypothetical protein
LHVCGNGKSTAVALGTSSQIRNMQTRKQKKFSIECMCGVKHQTKHVNQHQTAKKQSKELWPSVPIQLNHNVAIDHNVVIDWNLLPFNVGGFRL